MQEKIEAKIILLTDKFIEWLIGFIPHLISAIVIMVCGYYIARLFSKYTEQAIVKTTKDETLGVFLKNVVLWGFYCLLLLLH